MESDGGRYGLGERPHKDDDHGLGELRCELIETLESDGFVEFSAAGGGMLGLSKGDTDQNYNDIDFALFISSGTLRVYSVRLETGARSAR